MYCKNFIWIKKIKDLSTKFSVMLKTQRLERILAIKSLVNSSKQIECST